MFKTTLIAAMALAGAQAVNISVQRKGHDDAGPQTGKFDDGSGLAQIS